MRIELIEQAVIEHFRDVWLSPACQNALRTAIERICHQRDSEKPARLTEFETRVAKLDEQIRRGTENLLLVDPSDVAALTVILAGWRDKRDPVQAELDSERGEAAESRFLDADAILAELDHLEENLSRDNAALAKAAFGRIFKTITLFWKQVSPRCRTLERAEIETHFLLSNRGHVDPSQKPRSKSKPCTSHEHRSISSNGNEKRSPPRERSR